ncbi:MAG TPA: peptidylprolyl isomerase [Aliiroseovarius sp.]|nr:peptidylprolyl isomerase [Aliiroseovarius sp.]
MFKPKTAILATMFVIGTAFPSIAEEVSADTVLATVNGQDITMGHLIATRQSLPDQYQALPDEVLFEGILEQLIQQTLLSQAIGELTSKIELELENERRALIAGEKLDEVMADAVTEEALQAAYDETYANAVPETEFNASHILVDTQEKAAELVTMLEGGADFAALAKENSTGPSGPNGGELGWFAAGMMVQPFEEAVMGLTVGQVSAPVETQFGWHVIKLNETREKAAPSLDDVREELVSKIQDDAVENALAALQEAATIERTDLDGIDPATLRMDDLLD